ncbi:MAG: HAMP domain-containing histidine kinase [Planctomycetia bacterium]|nr:HAMP domain-containing histidine kinase [Planctomycetia bacterium]
MMQRLPEVARGELSVGLPLCDASADMLLRVLVSADRAAAQRAALEALRVDPALALWAICRADAVAPVTLEELSELLSLRLAEWLVWPAARADEHLQQTPFDPVRCADLAEASAAAAQSGSNDLQGLLHNADQWLAMAVGRPLTADELTAAIPAWLASHDSGVAGTSHDSGALPQAPTAARRHWQAVSPTADLLPEIAHRMARLSALEQRFDRMLEAEKLHALYKLAAGAGHEINNPLGSIAGRAQLLLRDEADPERRRTLAKINAQAFRAHEMIADMMLFARPPEPVRTEVDLAQVARDVLSELRESAAERNIELALAVDSDDAGAGSVVAQADAGQMLVALRAICINALDAIGGNGHVQVTVRRVDQTASPPQPAAQIVVRDDGPGITPDVRRHLFDPFFSGREAGRGLGFGLSKCWRIVTNHGGRIDVESTPGQGAQFTITLPV